MLRKLNYNAARGKQTKTKKRFGAADRVVVPGGGTEGNDGRTGKDRAKAKQSHKQEKSKGKAQEV